MELSDRVAAAQAVLDVIRTYDIGTQDTNDLIREIIICAANLAGLRIHMAKG